MLFDEFPEPEPFVQLAHQNQAIIGGDPRSLEVNLQSGVEGELKRLILFLTHWVSVSRAVGVRGDPAADRMASAPGTIAGASEAGKLGERRDRGRTGV
jgi:hypothetical protein